MIIEAGKVEEVVLMAELDLEFLQRDRSAWGVFRDRRPERYGDLLK